MLTQAPGRGAFLAGAVSFLGRVGDLVPHDRVDDLDPLPGDGLQRLPVAHASAAACPAVLSEPVLAPA